MRYRFAFGLARSGTTFLSDVLALTSSRVRYLREPLPRVKNLPSNAYAEAWFVPPRKGAEEIRWARNVIESVAESNQMLRDDLVAKTVYRDDPSPEFIIIKEVHALLTFAQIIEGLDFKAVAITRNPLRTLDSYFSGHTKEQRTYMVDEYGYIHEYLKLAAKRRDNELLNKALGKLSPRAAAYLRRPLWMTNELSRQACMTDLASKALEAWAEMDSRITLVRYDELCLNPIEETRRFFNFLDLGFSESTEAGLKQLTEGKNTGYYDTKKNSMEMLNRSFRVITPALQKSLGKLLG
ncbi:MAG: sulfotransferase domain-containing protein [Candidatus Sumerlaeota bacterium]|nr:sulfotransferase domain-containing protein [Candidatus Sumerlaeota bacterium]